MSENITNATNVNDTINTQQTEKQETVLVDNVVAENGGEQQTKAKKHTKLSEFETMTNFLIASGTIGMATNMPILINSIDELNNKEDDFYKFALGFSLVGLCKNICCLTYASIKLLKLKKKNKELKTETVLENDEEKQNKEIQVEVIPEEKKQEEAEIERRGLQRQKLQRQVKIYTLSNSELENKQLNLSKSKNSREH